MNARDSLLVALPAVLVGAGLGYFFASVGEGVPRRREVSSPSAVAPGPAFTPASETALAAPQTQAARTVAEPVVESAPRVSEAELERALAAVVVPASDTATSGTRTGAGIITGRVTDEAGAPLAGAVVLGATLSTEFAREPSEVGAGPPDEKGLEAFLREQAQTWAEFRAGRRRSATGTDGTFRLTNLDSAGSYSLSAFLEGYEVEVEGRAYSVSPGQTVNFRARRVHGIPIELVHENGSPANDGIVEVTRGDGHELFVWSAAEPELRIPGGLVGVRGYADVRQGGWRRSGVDSAYASAEVRLDVVANAAAPVRLVLKERCGIRGRVIDTWGGGNGQAVVRLLPIPAGTELDESALASSDRRTWQMGDRFEFLDLTAGTYAVGLSNWNGGLFAHEVVAVGAGVSEVDLVVSEPNPEQHLVVRAFGPGGNSLEDLDFRWRSSRDGGSRSGGIQGRRGPDGAYWLLPEAGFFKKWPSKTSYSLTIEHSQLGSRDFVLEEGQREVSVTFEEPISLVVVVAGYVGSGYESKIVVTLTRKDEAAPATRSRLGGGSGLSAEGVTRYDNLAPGTWEVGLHIMDGRRGGPMVQSREVRALAGEVHVEVSLPELYELTVLAPGLSVGTRVSLSSLRESGEATSFRRNYSATVEDDQRASIIGLVAGRYRLYARNAEPVEVVVPSAEVLLESKRED